MCISYAVARSLGRHRRKIPISMICWYLCACAIDAMAGLRTNKSNVNKKESNCMMVKSRATNIAEYTVLISKNCNQNRPLSRTNPTRCKNEESDIEWRNGSAHRITNKASEMFLIACIGAYQVGFYSEMIQSTRTRLNNSKFSTVFFLSLFGIFIDVCAHRRRSDWNAC